MPHMNYTDHMPSYITAPKFSDYAGFTDPRPVLIDCSLGTSPFGFPLPEPTMELPVSAYFKYPANARQLLSHLTARFPALNPARVVFGGGSDAVVSGLGRLFGGPKATVLGFVPQYLTALMYFETSGATVATTPWPAGDIDKLIHSLRPGATAVYLDNPHNPTGQIIPLADIRKLAQACLDQGIVLIVDEAYGDFMEDANSAINLPLTNVICIRSLSKGYGMAGLRIGYMEFKSQELFDIYTKTELLFTVSAPSADIAARLVDQVNPAQVRAQVTELKQQTMACLRQTGKLSIAPTSPSTPIMFVQLMEEGNLYDRLMDVGISTEMGEFFHMGPSYVRLRVPAPAQFTLFSQLLAKAFG